ncbi:MAG: ABC transporter ATP-binding protein [Gemmatimonadetes bacterium]|nr:ABC transporter ATP-binding protein [Gemmatimonadota bacterium]
MRFDSDAGPIHAVNGVSWSLAPGGSMAVVGESGSGKTVGMLSLLGLLPNTGRVEGGEAVFEGRDLLRLSPAEMREVRGGKIAMVFQDPMTSLNPVLSVGYQLTEGLRRHRGLSRRQARARAAELLDLVGIPDPHARLDDYPHEMSGGQRQRVMIAMALSCDPSLLVADEPTTALDVTIQAQIVELVKRLRTELGMAIVWITHDLSVVAGLVDRVAVMYAGMLLEEAPVTALYAHPRHPYTIGLLRSMPTLDGPTHTRLPSIEGAPPDLRTRPTGCPFAPRCPWVVDPCRVERPSLEVVSGEHRSACRRWRELDALEAMEASP